MLSITSVQAEKTSQSCTVLPWTGEQAAGSSWDNGTNLSWSKNFFQTAAAGDVIKVTVRGGNEGQYQLVLGSTNWGYNGDGEWAGTYTEATDADNDRVDYYTLDAAKVKLLKENGLQLKGKNVTFKGLSYQYISKYTELTRAWIEGEKGFDFTSRIPEDLAAGDEINIELSKQSSDSYTDYKVGVNDADHKTEISGSTKIQVTDENVNNLKSCFAMWVKKEFVVVSIRRYAELTITEEPTLVDYHTPIYNTYLKTPMTLGDITLLYGTPADGSEKTEWGESATDACFSLSSDKFTTLNVSGAGVTDADRQLAAGDTLFVYMSAVSPAAWGRLYNGNQTSGEQEWDGLTSKLGHFLVKGDFYFQVLDDKMVEQILANGLKVGGAGHNIEFVTIHKGRRRIAVSDKTGLTRITDNKELSGSGVAISGSTVTLTGASLQNTDDYTAYWGDRFLVAFTGNAKTCKAEMKDANGTVTETLTTEITPQGFYAYLHHRQALDLWNTISNGGSLVFTLDAGTVTKVMLLPDIRTKQDGQTDLNKSGDINWSTATRIVCSNIGNIHKGDKVTVEFNNTTSDQKQYSLQVMHYGETDNKGLWFNEDNGLVYTDIYDRLEQYLDGTYNMLHEYNWLNAGNTTITYTIPTEAIADNILANTFIITGQEGIHVNSVKVTSSGYNYPVSIPQGITSDMLSTYGKMQWAGLCAPYDLLLPHSDEADALRAYAVVGKGDFSRADGLYPLTLKRVYFVPQGECVLLKKSTEGQIDEFRIACKESGFTASAEEKAAYNRNMLKGHVVSEVVKATSDDGVYKNYALGYKPLKKDGTDRKAAFFPINGTKTIGANRIWLQVKAAEAQYAKGFVFSFDDEDGSATGISEVERTTSVDDAYYTLQGMKVTHPVKGIYIHNGKKVIVRK